jgi:hypothetical protein
MFSAARDTFDIAHTAPEQSVGDFDESKASEIKASEASARGFKTTGRSDITQNVHGHVYQVSYLLLW